MKPSNSAVRLAALLREPGIVQLPCCFDAFSAMLIERAGFKATFISGFASIAARYALPDMGLIDGSAALEIARPILERTSIPVFADIDTGYGGNINIRHTVLQFARAGAAAVMIEDQLWPKRCGHLSGKQVVSRGEAISRVEAAVAARDQAAQPLLILARTDARGTDGLDEALYRAQAFTECGADMIFVEAPLDLEELKQIPKRVAAPCMANMLEDGVTPFLDPEQLQDIGFKLVAYPLTLLSASAAAMTDALSRVKAGRRGGRRMRFDEMKTLLGFAELGAWGAEFPEK
ncbi:MAG: isocitrate lyase/PEP mutase family protein [Gammaproteobacteria bacterium]|nr:isocitrate lyase/PEP mutase family protein [Gammaproteobacteria bacterium]